MLEPNIKPSSNNKKEPSNKDICNAFGCSHSAENTINVNAGKFGFISLNVCSECIDIFKSEISSSQQREI